MVDRSDDVYSMDILEVWARNFITEHELSHVYRIAEMANGFGFYDKRDGVIKAAIAQNPFDGELTYTLLSQRKEIPAFYDINVEGPEALSTAEENIIAHIAPWKKNG